MIPTSDADASDGEREAEVASAGETPLGACIYLTPSQLETLGIDPEETATVAYEVDSEAERLIVEPATRGDDG